MNADRDNNGIGRLLINANAPISTLGGNITAKGNTNSPDTSGISSFSQGIDSGGGTITFNGTSTGPSNSTGIFSRGITVQGGPITSGGGEIVFNGNSSDGYGIAIITSIDSVGGKMTFNGTSTGTRIGTASDGIGIIVFGDSTITSRGGEIIFSGNSGDADGILVFEANGTPSIDSGGGSLTFNGTSTGRGRGVSVEVDTNSTGGNINVTGQSSNNVGINISSRLASGTGNLTLTADSISLDPNASITGTGNLVLQPLTPSLNLDIGGTYLSTAALEQLNNGGFASTTIGREDSSGAIAFADNVTFNNSVILRSPLGNGSINTTGFTLTGAGEITLLANQSITTGNITNPGQPITITSNNGNIDTSAGTLDSRATTGNGGAIALTASGNITTDNILSSSNANGNGGTISLTSTAGSINTRAGLLDSRAFNGGNSGSVTLTAENDIITGNIFSNLQPVATGRSGDISLLSAAGSIDTTAGALDVGVTFGNAGTIALQARNDITTADLRAYAVNSGQGNSGNLSLTSLAGNINTSTGTLSTNSDNGNGGAIALNADGNITTGAIVSSGSTQGQGGDITLNSPNDIQIASINAQGGTSGVGGTVDISTDSFFRATGTFTDQNGVTASISNAGGVGGSPIRIRHGGGLQLTPFDVGDATINGTAGAISNGVDTILPLRSLPGPYTQGDIRIITPNNLTLTQLETAFTKPENEPLPPPLTATRPGFLELDTAFAETEEFLASQFEQYLGLQPARTISLEEARGTLRKNQAATNITSALIYAVFVPETSQPNTSGVLVNPQIENQAQQLLKRTPQDRDQLELIVVTAQGKQIKRRVPDATRAKVLEVAKTLRSNVTDPRQPSKDYLPAAQQLHQWLVAPIEEDLQAQGIQNLIYIMDVGLRSVPLAALYDGRRFLIERYSVGLMPSLSLTDTRYQDVKKSQVLAMGASQFIDQNPLPAVPLELSLITPQLWQGKSFLNYAFTLNNLKAQRREKPFSIIHLATHAHFKPGAPSNSYIQLGNGKLSLNQLRQFGWNNPPVELLVLSACRTALGDREAELGFAGLAVQAGVKSALGSVWNISDQGTLALMTEFYQQLKKAPMKAEALRQAQLAMLKGEVRVEGGELRTTGVKVPLPPELAKQGDHDFSHPNYWAGFTIIGSPW